MVEERVSPPDNAQKAEKGRTDSATFLAMMAGEERPSFVGEKAKATTEEEESFQTTAGMATSNKTSSATSIATPDSTVLAHSVGSVATGTLQSTVEQHVEAARASVSEKSSRWSRQSSK